MSPGKPVSIKTKLISFLVEAEVMIENIQCK